MLNDSRRTGFRHGAEVGIQSFWIPAFAEMTEKKSVKML